MVTTTSHIHQSLRAETQRRGFATRYRRMVSGDPHLAPFSECPALLAALHGESRSAKDKNAILGRLVKQLQGGAEVAQVVLLLALWPGIEGVISRIARQYLIPRKTAEPEVAAKILVNASKLDLSNATVIASTLLKNAKRDVGRDLQKEVRLSASQCELVSDFPDSTSSCPAEAMSQKEMAEKARECLGTDANYVIAVSVEGFTHAEAAARMGQKPEAARKKYQRALKTAALNM